MEVKQAIQVLKDHNKWRKGEDEELQMTDPKKLGISIDTVVNKFENLFLSDFSTRSFNELEMLAEDLECVKMWLDDKKAPKTDSDGNEYSVVGRIQCLLNVC